MSLYALDIIPTREGKDFVSEVSGVGSSMAGFRNVHGDNRVEERVWQMLREKYGKITVNTGRYSRQRARAARPIWFAAFNVAMRTPIISDIFWRYMMPPVLDSSKAHTDWRRDRSIKQGWQNPPFEFYIGQESTVLNLVNQTLPHPLVNPFVAEALTRNKFLQYLTLRESEIGGSLPRSTLVGLGATHEKELEEILESGSEFAVKPVRGFCGRGFQRLTKDEAAQYMKTRGPVERISVWRSMAAIDRGRPAMPYFEDYVDAGNFDFEAGISVLQPFIDSRGAIGGSNGHFCAVRAIVCNGEFVDAYFMTSPNPAVNMAKGAVPHAFEADERFRYSCERTAAVLEEESARHSPDGYKKKLYTAYIDARGRTTKHQRKADSSAPLVGVVSSMIAGMRQ